MLKYIRLLGQFLMGFSILFVVFKMGSIGTAIIIFTLGLIIYIFGKLYNKNGHI
ncbi:hypothetical protein [Paenibacillus apis]|uniref:Uncharacterized protein n=1 Tax=Paenibacillus apis TaxID=1792174 RepID=A0A919Y4K2_9BACL|nr:hypothetical protein [Paenibacillus apis]GIO42285.1 hypothetical protein J41TS4_20430 [Paenibacillus apis]